MENKSCKKQVKRGERKVIGLRLPPIESNSDSVKVKTVRDVDPDYFSLVEGRPIRSNNSINAYKQNIRDVSMNRTVNGFLTEEILRIDKEIATETCIFESAAKHFDECKKSFDKFLAYDNDKTISVMRKSDALNKELMNKTEDHKKTNYEMATLKSNLQYIDETLLILLSFELFLHRVSPHLWQKSQNIDLGIEHSEICSLDTDIFKEIQISVIVDKLNKLPPPRLYFETPEQLLNIFYLLEKQNLNYLLLTEEMNSLKNKFFNVRDTFKDNLKKELNVIQGKIMDIEDVIQWHMIKETQIKEVFFKILEEKMRFLISSEAALQIYTYVGYAYEQVIAPNDTNQSTLEMALALEVEYNNILLELSEFDLNLVKDIERKTFEKGDKEIRDAKEANKMIKNIDKISKRLKASYQPGQSKSS